MEGNIEDLNEKVSIFGVRKKRWRCPECKRGLIDGHCVVHGILNPEDILKYSKEEKLGTIMYSVYRFISDGNTKINADTLEKNIGLKKEYYKDFTELNKEEIEVYVLNGVCTWEM